MIYMCAEQNYHYQSYPSSDKLSELEDRFLKALEIGNFGDDEGDSELEITMGSLDSSVDDKTSHILMEVEVHVAVGSSSLSSKEDSLSDGEQGEGSKIDGKLSSLDESDDFESDLYNNNLIS
jgi:hypothetical protein